MSQSELCVENWMDILPPDYKEFRITLPPNPRNCKDRTKPYIFCPYGNDVCKFCVE